MLRDLWYVNIYGKKYQYCSEILNIGVKEIYNKKNTVNVQCKTRFLLPSFYFDYLKGQDLLLKAILNLPQEYLEKRNFILWVLYRKI